MMFWFMGISLEFWINFLEFNCCQNFLCTYFGSWNNHKKMFTIATTILIITTTTTTGFFIPLCTNRASLSVCGIYSVSMVVMVSSCKVWLGKGWKPLVFCTNNTAKLSLQSEPGMSKRNNSTSVISFSNGICLSELW